MKERRTNKYAIGHEDTTGGWGLKAWDIDLEAVLRHKGERGDRILRFTKRGLKPIYSWRKNEWRETI